MIEKILGKQKVRVFLDEEIETWEDDLNEIEKVVETKQLYSEELTARIGKKQKEYEQESKIKDLQNKLNRSKSSPSILRIIFGWGSNFNPLIS